MYILAQWHCRPGLEALLSCIQCLTIAFVDIVVHVTDFCSLVILFLLLYNHRLTSVVSNLCKHWTKWTKRTALNDLKCY